MRFLLAASRGLAFTATAQAAELTVLAPGFVKNAGIDDLAAAYSEETGVQVTVNSVGMGAMMDTINTGPRRRCRDAAAEFDGPARRAGRRRGRQPQGRAGCRS